MLLLLVTDLRHHRLRPLTNYLRGLCRPAEFQLFQRGQIRAAKVVLGGIGEIYSPIPANRLLFLDHILGRFVLTGHGDIIVGIVRNILPGVRDLDDRRLVCVRGNFDHSVHTLCVNCDRCADKCCKQEATFESIRRHCDGSIFKWSSQGGRRSNELPKAGQAPIFLASCQTKPY